MVLNKKWSYIISEKAKGNLSKLDKNIQKQILLFMDKVVQSPNPRAKGAALHGNLKNYWRYRVGDYRLVCHMKDESIIITVVKIGHRKNIYR